MPFFRPAYLAPEASFFQLLSELDQPQQKQCAPRQQKPRTFTPRFDVTEIDNAYELYGELPGIEQKDITIEFSDAQTLVIKGKTERQSDKVEAPQAEATPAAEDNTSEKSHNPTPKYWIAERRVGSFSRSFSFSQRIEHEAVQASLKNGILKVVVPKSQKSGKIAVNVL
ncbi:HSP20-like chaperone [Hyaloscypha hepaticicola]|uniref:HSP20-like chaperone n=1 Tax=Hyaloscypha hepaticicola TaxID=2082293 RepID=A0A2J6QEA5_9HELO|nr:HSP20-like chaperone [Hyaloscypha hepaticicola]